jgi:signal transduction histidine kinase
MATMREILDDEGPRRMLDPATGERVRSAPRRTADSARGWARAQLAYLGHAISPGLLAASIAHEVNQPLSGIMVNAGICLKMLDAEPPDIEGARAAMCRTLRDCGRMSEMIVRLRTLFAGKSVPIEPLDLNEVTRETVAMALADLQRNRVDLRTELENDLPPVGGDRLQLQQVILNLLLNACEAMKDADDRTRLILLKTERDDGNRVRLSVRDSGTGLGAEPADRLFDPFYTTKAGGMGIGLFVSRSIIESHQGRLRATSNDGPGATFSFSLPRARGAQERSNNRLDRLAAPPFGSRPGEASGVEDIDHDVSLCD